MSSSDVPDRLPADHSFQSVREACRHALSHARTPAGQFLPMNVAELVSLLSSRGFVVNERDVEDSLRDLAAAGEAVEIDAQAGFRWNEPAA